MIVIYIIGFITLILSVITGQAFCTVLVSKHKIDPEFNLMAQKLKKTYLIITLGILFFIWFTTFFNSLFEVWYS